ncbi:MAG: DUF2993 domain-containing protein [Gloeocapsa sp. DLM2.Bin57]|nr:MAG: DUF2993 domain-containing protein [Gloeocapsa sp. DLM2.Bin57]
MKDIISKVLSPAVNLWLHSQLDKVEQLQINITGTNRQILTGYIPGVSLGSIAPVYQGIHLNQVELTGENIKINLGQVIKGQPLRLLEPILVKGKIALEQTQLNLSLSSDLLTTALTDLLKSFIKGDYLHNLQINWQNLEIHSDKLILRAIAIDSQGTIVTPISWKSGLSLASHRKLLLHPIQIETSSEQITLHNYEVDLGSQVQLENLTLAQGRIDCYGTATIVSE